MLEFLRTDRVVRCNLAAIALLCVGTLQMIGFVFGSSTLRGIGAATGASPLPKVFSALRGYETFAANFVIVYEVDSQIHRCPITPELYQKLRGPYNRRNVYGAALSYGPVLPEALWRPVLQFALKPDGPFRRELELPSDAKRVRVEIRSLTKGRDESWTLDPDYPGCAK